MVLLKIVFIGGIEYKILSILIHAYSYIMLADGLVLLFNKKKRAIHDYLAHSFVVTKESLKHMNKNSEFSEHPTVIGPES